MHSSDANAVSQCRCVPAFIEYNASDQQWLCNCFSESEDHLSNANFRKPEEEIQVGISAAILKLGNPTEKFACSSPAPVHATFEFHALYLSVTILAAVFHAPARQSVLCPTCRNNKALQTRGSPLRHARRGHAGKSGCLLTDCFVRSAVPL